MYFRHLIQTWLGSQHKQTYKNLYSHDVECRGGIALILNETMKKKTPALHHNYIEKTLVTFKKVQLRHFIEIKHQCIYVRVYFDQYEFR